MLVFIPEDVVIDGDLPTPGAGVILPRMAVRLWDDLHRDDHTTINGTVTSSRHDKSAELVETLISTAVVDVHIQSDGTESDVAVVGSRISLTGLLHCIRPYEFDAFDLPDTSRAWLVKTLIRRDSRGWTIDADPLADTPSS